MKRLPILILCLGLVITCVVGNSFAENSDMVISEIIKGLTDIENGQSCRYNENDNLLLYEIELPITYDDFQSRSVGEVGEYFKRFEAMAKYLKETVVTPYIPDATSAMTVVSSDRIPVAVFVNTTDLLHGWF